MWYVLDHWYYKFWERKFSGMVEMVELAETAELLFTDYGQPHYQLATHCYKYSYIELTMIEAHGLCNTDFLSSCSLPSCVAIIS